jgi:two-component system, chemotaxis family, sensor kinase CheA
MNEEIGNEFLVESNENLDRLDQDFVKWEKEPSNLELVKGIFRAIHTIKGTCGFLGFSKLESLTHLGESLLSRLRDGEIKLDPEITTALLQMVDATRAILREIEVSGAEGDTEYPELIGVLKELQHSKNAPAESGRGAQAPADAIENVPSNTTEEGTDEEAQTADTTGDTSHERVLQADQSSVEKGHKFEAPEIIDARIGGRLVSEREEQVIEALKLQQEGDGRRLGEILVSKGAVTEREVEEVLAAKPPAEKSEGSIRVDVGLLDKLMNLVGELVLARNQILQFSNATEEAGIVAPSQRLNLITTELQEGVMKTRMQPIGNIWSKFPRTVRDVASSCAKQVRIEMEGKETELDKTIIEAIKDPLTHIVRNSVDHGIETPAERIAAGKSAEGRLLLRAYHEGGQVNIEISDDGAGLDLQKIRRKAVEKAVVTAEQAAKMTDREVANLIFLPGFSTAEKVTNVSGRGVGMDVVKTNIDKIGGTVDLHTKHGAGTTVRMKIPLTLAIIPALIVTNQGERYAIPQISLLELVRFEGEEAYKRIEWIQGAPVHRLRGRLLPLVYLGRELHMQTAASAASKNDVVNIVVLQADERQFGLVVDEINDTEEIVVKPLGKLLKGIKTFAGSTIMGDGRVALILDVLGLAQSASVVSGSGSSRDRAMGDKENGTAAAGRERQAMLLLQCGAHERMAMELSLVARLEEFKPELVERAGGLEVVQYRGEIMPLIRISEVLQLQDNQAASDQAGTVQVVVYSKDGRSVGLVVDRILDIVEESFVCQQASKRDGLLGSAVIQQRVTDLLDVRSIIRNAMPTFFESHAVLS